MRQETRLLKLEALTQHIADAEEGPPSMIGKPFYVVVAEHLDWLRAEVKNRQRSAEDREYAQQNLTQFLTRHGEWTVEQGWRHYHAGGVKDDDRRDGMEPLPGWQDFPLSRFQTPQNTAIGCQ